MKFYIALGLVVFFYYSVTHCTGDSSENLMTERHSRVRYLPTDLIQKSTPRPFMHSWDSTTAPPRSIKTHKKRRKVIRKRPKINITEIVGYLNSNTPQVVNIINPEIEYLNTLANVSVGEENVVSNLNALRVNVKNFSCDVNNGGCSQFCKETNGVQCTCLKGFVLGKDRKSCLDVNECRQENGGCSHGCVNTYGFYHCTCPRGLRLGNDGKTCKDINECLLRNGHGPCQDICKNTYGSYECACSIKSSSLSPNLHSCEDINECLQGTSDCSHGCINIIGGVICTCPYGMILKEDLKNCQDPEEQSDDTGVCPPILPSKNGYLRCQRKNPFEYYDMNRDVLMTSREGVTCTLVCQRSYKTIGQYRVTCHADGTWFGNQTGKCLRQKFNRRKNFIEVIWRYVKPKIICSPPILLHVDENMKFARVRVKPPKTNVNWGNVKSFPRDLKATMEIYLPVGHHSVIFEATDMMSKLSSKCIISIIIRRQTS